MNQRKIKKKLFIGFFLVILVSPTLIQLADFRTKNNSAKGKTIPNFEFPHIGRFRNNFDNFYKKNFGGRDFLIEKYNQAKFLFLMSSPLPNSVVIGKDGWLFLGNSYSNIIYETSGMSNFTHEELDNIQSRIKSREKWLADRNIKYYVCVAPNKHSIYSDKLPDHIKYAPGKTKLYTLKTYLGKNNFNLIDLSNKFDDYIDQYRLFHKTDTHWNEVGSFLGYQALMNPIKADFPDVDILKFNDFKVDTVVSMQQDLTKMINTQIREDKIELNFKSEPFAKEIDKQLTVPENYFRDPKDYERRFKNDKKLKILIFRDSFSDALLKFIPESFGETVFIWHYGFNKEIIEREKPDIVVHEIVERSIDVLLKEEGSD